MKQQFSERYRLARIRDEAILLDLETGNYFGVQGTALVACESLVSNDSVARAANEVAKHFHVAKKIAERDVASFLSSLRARRRKSRRTEFDARASAAHELALRGHTILHASAITRGNDVVAFVAESGTGKSTIAKMLARRNRVPVSDDLVALDARLRVRVEGESAIRAWARSKTRDENPLAKARATRTLAAVFLVRRAEGLERVRTERMGKIAGMAALLENAFVEIPDPGVWARALEVSRRLVARRIVYALEVPQGRARLSRALEEWSARGLAIP